MAPAIYICYTSTNNMKKRLTVLFMFISVTLSAQPDSTIKINKKYIVGISPSRATHVYGLLFNFWQNSDDKYATVQGAEINLNPLGLYFSMLALVFSATKPYHALLPENMDSLDFKKFKKINGLYIGLVNMESSKINGVAIELAGGAGSVINGITAAALVNKNYIINGITIGLIGNQTTKCNGIQAGIINSSARLRGFQFGIWNKNQKRSLPLVNWCFTK